MNKNLLAFLQILDHQAASGVTEVCVFRDGEVPTHVGYFNNTEAAAKAIEKFDGQGNIFVTLDPAKPDLLGRYNNHLVEGSFKRRLKRTKNEETLCKSWLFFDIDAKRPSGISSTDDELSAAIEVGQAVREWLLSLGVPPSAILTAKSGNGVYVLVRLPDYSIASDQAAILPTFVKYAASLFNTEQVKIDDSVHNAARLCGALGTMKVKGEDIPQRPHRRSSIGTVGGESFDPEKPQRCEPFDIAALAARIVPKEEPKPANAFQKGQPTATAFDIREHLHQLHNQKGPARGFIYANCPGCGGAQKLFVNESTGAYGCFHIFAGTCSIERIREALGRPKPLPREQVSVPASHVRGAAALPVIAAPSNGSSPVKPHPVPAGQEFQESQELQEKDPWETPTLFHEYDLPAFPIEALPTWVGAFVKAIAQETQTPVDLPACLSLSALSGAVAGNVEITARAGWREPLNLFMAVSLLPGNRKSAVFMAIVRALQDAEREMVALKRGEVAKAESERRTMEARIERLEKESAKTDDDDDARAKQNEAIRLAQKLATMEVPKLPRLLADDATPETLATLLHDQKGRIGLFSPEGDVFDIMAGRYSNGAPNFGVFLKGHAGDDLRIDRRGRCEYVKRPALTIGLALQPDVLRGLVARPGFKGRGLLGRFLYSIPQSLLGTRKTRVKPVDESIRANYDKRLKAMAGLDVSFDEDGHRLPHQLSLAQDADDLLIAFQDEIEPGLAEDGELSGLADWASKLAGAALRIAGVLHVAENTGRFQAWPATVPAETMEKAIEIARYFIPHAQAAYAEMGADPEIESAKYLLRWVLKWKEAGNAEFRKQDAWQGTKGRFKKASDLDKSLALLVEYEYIRALVKDNSRSSGKESEEKRRGRKPGGIYEINPLASSYNSYNPYNSVKADDSRNSRNSRNEDKEEISEIPLILNGKPQTVSREVLAI